MVTAASFTARLSLRCSSIFLDALFEAAKYGTVLSLGLSRNALTNALSTAKNIHDTSPKRTKYTDIGLHIVSHTFSLAELFAISGLQFTSRTIQSSLKVAEESVRIIDGIFGSNDTSRAIASIITLVHRELVQDPEFGLAKAGKIAILAGLTKALTAFAVLQNVTHKRMMKHIPMTKKSSYRNNDMDNIMYYDHGWNFPQTHIVHNIAHFMRYASAAYGESFMRILGIGDIPTVLPNSHHHHPNHHAFAHHTGNSVEDILLSSYTNRSPLYLHNPSIHALVHYVTVDHAAKAIVLTCRGTLGLSDLLTDLSFDYTDFNLPSESTKFFKAHSGMLDAAQLLAKEKGEVYQKIRQGLQSYPDYGLVMCGHSLGGGVASLLCVLWSQQIKRDQGNKRLPSFVTSNQSGLPAGRPIHCYAYGPPGVMSLELSNYCAGLVTSVVYGYDIVSSLSWGILKDFKNIATSLHTEADVAEEIIARVIGRMQEQNYKNEDELNEDDQWFWAMIKTMRADMTAEKMYPPSIVYSIETIPHVKEQHKVVLYRCDDVQARFSEIVFSKTMFMDHSPLMYERAIKKLCRSFTESFSE
ncbi:Alpha/Beta hydrolase protein [Gilbertella persicaria]|nr:Alpha/Beta hydrolase protein [Gilbertella persicaria]KAI8062360.1 Alpha/Beta hydrolase protein [Gilbertella persicaria]